MIPKMSVLFSIFSVHISSCISKDQYLQQATQFHHIWIPPLHYLHLSIYQPFKLRSSSFVSILLVINVPLPLRCGASLGCGKRRQRVAVSILDSSRGQPTRDSPPAWCLGEGLRTFHCKRFSRYEMYSAPAQGMGECGSEEHTWVLRHEAKGDRCRLHN